MLVRNSGAAVGYLLAAGRLPLCAGPLHGIEQVDGLRNTEKMRKELTPLSSVACGATSFLRKEALAVRHVTNGQAPSSGRGSAERWG